MNNLHAVGLYQ